MRLFQYCNENNSSKAIIIIMTMRKIHNFKTEYLNTFEILVTFCTAICYLK